MKGFLFLLLGLSLLLIAAPCTLAVLAPDAAYAAAHDLTATEAVPRPEVTPQLLVVIRHDDERDYQLESKGLIAGPLQWLRPRNWFQGQLRDGDGPARRAVRFVVGRSC